MSTDKEFAPKAADVVGLYLDPPLNAVVLSVDEKPSIQAIERPSGYIETDSGAVVRGLKSTYKRHGTLNLFAALEVATGQAKTKITEFKKRADFQSFLEGVIAEQSADKEIHVISGQLLNAKEARRVAREVYGPRAVSLHADLGELAQSDRDRVQPAATEGSHWSQLQDSCATRSKPSFIRRHNERAKTVSLAQA